MIESIHETRPRLFWLSVSYIADELRFVDSVNALFQAAYSTGCAVAIGGQALHPSLRKRIQYSAACDSFRDLEFFARSLHPAPGQPTPPIETQSE